MKGPVFLLDGTLERGYVKLWRKTLDSGLLGHPNAWTLFTWMLLQATRHPQKRATKWGVIDLAAGQLLISRSTAMKELRLTEREARTAMELLRKLEIVSSETSNGLTRITIMKWEEYQGAPSGTSSPPSSIRPAPVQDPSREQEREKERKTQEGGDAFDTFWKAFPRKVGRMAALKAWTRSKPDLAACLKALEWQKQSLAWTKEGGAYIPHPSTWLNQGRWMDEQASAQTYDPMTHWPDGRKKNII